MAFANNPSQTDAVFDLADGLRQTDLYEQFLERAHSQPAVDRIIRERYLAPVDDLERLLDGPPDSLGYQYAAQMKRMGLRPDFYPQLVVEDDYSYIALRLRQTHDIWHAVTGFGTDLAGEVGLQAFLLAQMRSPLAVAIMAGSAMYALKSSTPLSPLVDRIHQGWQMGEKASPFLAQKWEENWEKSLSEWRDDLNVEAV
jgi:ubiquinone biosynthesis protein Coq4